MCSDTLLIDSARATRARPPARYQPVTNASHHAAEDLQAVANAHWTSLQNHHSCKSPASRLLRPSTLPTERSQAPQGYAGQTDRQHSALRRSQYHGPKLLLTTTFIAVVASQPTVTVTVRWHAWSSAACCPLQCNPAPIDPTGLAHLPSGSSDR